MDLLEVGVGWKRRWGSQEVDTAWVRSIVSPENARGPEVKNLMGQEAGLQEKEKLKGMGKQFECAVQMVCMINYPH